MKRTRLHILVSIALLVAAIVGVQVQRATAGVEVCPCVILIEVDGLEPKDVTAETTPWLWALAHSGDVHSATDTTTLQQDQAAIAIAQSPAFTGRNGFAWQAARGVMSASGAAGTTTLLTGSYADQDDVPADEYTTAASGSEGRYLLGGSLVDDQIKAIDSNASSSKLLPDLITESSDNKVAAFVGDPRLAFGLLAPTDTSTWYTWPDSASAAQQASVPAYCPVPQDTAQWEAYNSTGSDGTSNTSQFYCPTADANVAYQAYNYMQDGGKSGKVNFAYMYLAELGAVKRIYGDVDADAAGASTDGTAAQGQQIPAVQSQLAATDAAIGAFITGYQHQQPDKWAQTDLMVVGNHGYELTPSVLRVPDPSGATPTMSLEQYVQSESNSAHLVPEGSYATIYVDPSTADRAATIKKLADDFKPGGDSGGPVDKQPQCVNSPAGGCIDQVLYTDPALDPSGGKDTICRWVDNATTPAGCQHPTWHLHYTKDGKASGSDGDLVITMKPGWAAGQLLPTATNPTSTYGTVSPDDPQEGTVTNPYIGSAGGPRNRAVAAIVNGPNVTQVHGNSYPVIDTKTALNPDTDCPKANQPISGAVSDQVANANPGDDANDLGHECQAETVDFAPSIAALLRVSVPDTQLGGRFLLEAIPGLTRVREDEALPPPPPEDPLPPPEPDIHIPPPPPPPTGFACDKLVCGQLTTQVVDKNGCPWSRARPGSKLDFLKIEGDFGKPQAAVTLTFYQEKAEQASRGGARKRARGARVARVTVPVATIAATSHCSGKPSSGATASAAAAKRPKLPPLKAIAHFNPFKLKRGHVVLSLKIPDTFHPSHIGIYVREARQLAKPNAKGLAFEAFGPAIGDIVPIKDAARLHATKPGRARK